MSNVIEVKVPDIGDFSDVEIIEILVNVGDTIAAEDSLISVESDKASMEIPAPQGGVVKELLISLGDKVSEGSAILMLEVGAAAAASAPAAAPAEAPKAAEPAPTATPAPVAASFSGDVDIATEVVVLGSGPGGRLC